MSSIETMIMAFLLSWEYTCAEGSRALNAAASACHDARVCVVNLGTCKQAPFASCAA